MEYFHAHNHVLSDFLVFIKKQILQLSLRLYNSLGLLAPDAVQAKISMQELWQQKIQWDEPFLQD